MLLAADTMSALCLLSLASFLTSRYTLHTILRLTKKTEGERESETQSERWIDFKIKYKGVSNTDDREESTLRHSESCTVRPVPLKLGELCSEALSVLLR